MPRLVLKNFTENQNAAYTGLNGEVVNVIGVGYAIHDGFTAGGTVYETQKLIAGRNIIRNGDFAVQQNGVQWEGVPTSGNYHYVADGWYYQRDGGSTANVAVTENYLDSVKQLRRAMRVTTFSGGASNSFSIISQRMSGALLLSGRTLTLSFWAKCASDRSIAIELGNDFKSTVTGQRVSVGKANLTTQWQKFEFTFKFSDRPSTMTVGANNHSWLYFWLEAGDDLNSRTGGINTFSGSFDFAEIQLEESEIATPFDRLEYHRSLNIVREYFEKATINVALSKYGDTLDDSKAGAYIPFAVPKRTTPTVTPTFGFLDGGQAYWPSTQGFNVVGTANSNISVSRLTAYTANAEITP